MADFLAFIGGSSLVELCLFALMVVFFVSMILAVVYLFISFLLRRMKQEGVDRASIGIASIDFDDEEEKSESTKP
jgi:cbb3-type cytochrome oxidase subunit 3